MFARLLRRLPPLRNQHRSTKSLILLSKTCSRCLLRSARNQANYTPGRPNPPQRSPASPRSRPTSGLQPIRASQLVRARKLQIRGVFNSIRLRNLTAPNPHLLPRACLRNRPFYRTKHRPSPTYLAQRYRASCHTNCPLSLAAYIVHLPSELLSASPPHVTAAASAAVLSDRTMACIGTYEQSISTKRFAGIAVGSSRSGTGRNPQRYLGQWTENSVDSLLLYMYY